jgi:hypothetical protein
MQENIWPLTLLAYPACMYGCCLSKLCSSLTAMSFRRAKSWVLVGRCLAMRLATYQCIVRYR